MKGIYCNKSCDLLLKHIQFMFIHSALFIRGSEIIVWSNRVFRSCTRAGNHCLTRPQGNKKSHHVDIVKWKPVGANHHCGNCIPTVENPCLYYYSSIITYILFFKDHQTDVSKHSVDSVLGFRNATADWLHILWMA